MKASPSPATLPAPVLRAEGLGLSYGAHQVITRLDLDLPPGKISAILGPNGCGKSTLLHALAGLTAANTGRVSLNGKDLRLWERRELARHMAILPQAPLAPEGILVRDLVARGRAPWRRLLQPWGPEDAAACDDALRAVGLQDMADRVLSTLSGGQRQRAWIALVLTQSTPLLLLDEPTTWLDLPHQIEILRLLHRLNRTRGLTVISVLHDLNLSARFCDHLLLFGPKGLLAAGPPAQVITEDNLAHAFGLAARVLPDPVSGAPFVHPL